MANIYKIRLSGRGTTVAGSTQSEYLTGTLVGISWPGKVGTTQRHSTDSDVTFSVTPNSSNQYFFRINKIDKTTGARWYPTVAMQNTSGEALGAIGTSASRMCLPLCRDRIKMNWAASTHKSCGHLDIDLYIDGPPGLMGATDYNN
jgi:hypothetical protein